MEDKREYTLGTELMCEAAAALLDTPEQMTELITPEEVAEFEALRQRLLDLEENSHTGYAITNNDKLSIAAESEI